jgi:protein SCO1/2
MNRALPRGHRVLRYRAVIHLLSTCCLMTLALTAVLVAGAQAHKAQPGLLGKVGIEQRLTEQVPLDLAFRDEAGRAVRLGDYFDGKPAILALVYYECSVLCPLRLDGLVSSLRALPFNVGDQFTVVTLSIDPRETAPLAAAKKEVFLRHYARPCAAHGWHFLIGEETAIARLAEAVGFRYAYDAVRDEYAHASGITVLTPQGKVASYFYGIEPPPKDLRLALVEASANTIGSLVDQVLLLCFHYDPATARYGAAAINAVRLGGVLTVLALGAFIGTMSWREIKRGRGKAGGGS